MRILVVEDEDSIASFVVKGLTAEGHTVQRASNVSEGIALGTSYDFDLVLLDLILPDGRGLEVLKAIRVGRPDLPVIVVSALGEIDDKVDLLDAGADDYLVKPFAFAELAARVRAAARQGAASARVADGWRHRARHQDARRHAGRGHPRRPPESGVRTARVPHAA